MNNTPSFRVVFLLVFLEVNLLWNLKKNIPEPEMTSEGKYRCRKDNQEYDNREDYESHCMEEHASNM
jgi:hypothetical protein